MPHAQFNRFELENFGKMAANAYLDGDVELNDTITKLAREHSLNSHQIDRVAQNANILVNGSLVTQARENGKDPRVTFPLADSAAIGQRLDDAGEKAAELRKEAEVISLFKVDRKPPASVIDQVIGTQAPDPYAHNFVSRDHIKMAADFIKNASQAVEDSENTTAATLSYVCSTLESMRHRALTDHSLAKVAMDDAEASLRQEINDQILSGMAPATIRDVVKAASLDEKTVDCVDRLVTKVAAGLGAREGKSAFCDKSLTNKQHPLITKAAEIQDRVQAAVTSHQGLDKLAAAHQAARVQYNKAVREGR